MSENNTLDLSDISSEPGESNIQVEIVDVPEEVEDAEEEVDDASLIWTFLHTPSIFYPMFLGPNNLPFGLHFVCKRKQDYRLINAINYLIEKNILSSKISQAKI